MTVGIGHGPYCRPCRRWNHHARRGRLAGMEPGRPIKCQGRHCQEPILQYGAYERRRTPKNKGQTKINREQKPAGGPDTKDRRSPPPVQGYEKRPQQERTHDDRNGSGVKGTQGPCSGSIAQRSVENIRNRSHLEVLSERVPSSQLATVPAHRGLPSERAFSLRYTPERI
jgi:hypothetical protein